MVQHSAKQLNKCGDTRGLHPNSLKNIGNTKWKPGESGNPKGLSITARQQMMMPEVCPFDSQGRTWLDAEAEAGLRQALTMPSAMANLQDRHEGKVPQPVTGSLVLRHDVSFTVGKGYENGQTKQV